MFKARKGHELYVLAELCFSFLIFIVPAILVGYKLYAIGNYPALFHTIALAVVITFTSTCADRINDSECPGIRHLYYLLSFLYVITFVICLLSAFTGRFPVSNLLLAIGELLYAYIMTLAVFWPVFQRGRPLITKHLSV